MSKPVFKTLVAADDGLDLNGVEVSDAIDISHLESFAVMIGGTFVGTLSIELSFDGGSTWVPHPDMIGKTAPAVIPDGGIRTKLLRANVTAYTSGTPRVMISGSDEDTRS